MRLETKRLNMTAKNRFIGNYEIKEEDDLAYTFEYAMNVKHNVKGIHCYNTKMEKMVEVISEISEMYEICMPRYYFLKQYGKWDEDYLGRAVAGIDILQRKSKIQFRPGAGVKTAIHEMAHIVCFHLERKHELKFSGHGSLFVGILTYLYQRLGYWGKELCRIPEFARASDKSNSASKLEYDFNTLYEKGYLPQDEYTYDTAVKMWLQKGNYKEVLAKVNMVDITTSCYNWYIGGQGRRFSKEEKLCIKEKLEDMVLCMEDNTIEGVAEFASNCEHFSTELFKEDPTKHVVDCYIDGITETIFDFISYNGLELYEV